MVRKHLRKSFFSPSSEIRFSNRSADGCWQQQKSGFQREKRYSKTKLICKEEAGISLVSRRSKEVAYLSIGSVDGKSSSEFPHNELPRYLDVQDHMPHIMSQHTGHSACDYDNKCHFVPKGIYLLEVAYIC